MITASADITIDRPIEDVFAFLTETADHQRWDSTSIEMVPSEPGPWRRGLEFRGVRLIGRRPTEVRSRIAAFEPNQSMDLESLTGPNLRGHWRLSAADGRTHFRWTGELEPSGLARVFASHRASVPTDHSRKLHEAEEHPGGWPLAPAPAKGA